MGYLDPIVIQGSEYSAMTDGYAVGITLLVCLTNRSATQIFNACEDQFEEDFDDIDAALLAGVLHLSNCVGWGETHSRSIHWCSHVAVAVQICGSVT